MNKKTQGMLSIENKNIFAILKRRLYSEHDIVFRELVSNGIDAINKLLATGSNIDFRVDVRIDTEDNLLVISDNGIGMSVQEVKKYINQIAFSGAEDYIRQNDEANDNIIGHFGVGFYSAFMLTDHVSIETKSYVADAPAVRWDCTADMSFSMREGCRTQPGTDVIMHLPENSLYLRNPMLALDAVRKYFLFAKIPVFFTAPKQNTMQITQPNPLWQRAPENIDGRAMDEFYQDFFDDNAPPLFWMQIASPDLGLRGILYFRNTKNGTDELDGIIKVYCRGVYVGENIQGLIPKFVNLQNGIIECDQLPLVVSRSGLLTSEEQEQGDIITLVNECLAQEVIIELNDMFLNRRSEYEGYWPEINAFVKYGILQDKTFASVMTRKVIFEDIYGAYHTIPEYTEGSRPQSLVVYASDKLDQAHYIEIFRKLQKNALLFDHVIDQPLLFKYETVFPKLKFIRIDSNAVDVYHGVAQPGDKALTASLQARLVQALGQRLGAVELRFTHMDSAEVSALIVNDEQARRMADMMEIYGYLGPDDLAAKEKQAKSTLLLNLNNDAVRFLCDTNNDAMFSVVANQLFDLALISQQLLKPQDMEGFLSRSEEILNTYMGSTEKQDYDGKTRQEGLNGGII